MSLTWPCSHCSARPSAAATTRACWAELMNAECSSRWPQYGHVSSISSGSASYSSWRILNGASHAGHSDRSSRRRRSGSRSTPRSRPRCRSLTPSGSGRCSRSLMRSVKHSALPAHDGRNGRLTDVVAPARATARHAGTPRAGGPTSGRAELSSPKVRAAPGPRVALADRLTAQRCPGPGRPSRRRSDVGHSGPGLVPGQDHAVGKRPGLHQGQVHPVV